jgi:UDP-2-acetamido-3-amino-2,3-dideoxy-glucuronate N-acetyltransferase
MSGYIAHPTAEISGDATIGDGTRIWQHCIIMGGAQLGRDCKLGHNVFVEGGVLVGDGVVIKDNVCLYQGLVVGDDVFIGPNAVFTNVRTPRAFVSRKSEFEATDISRGATIGANATIVCGNRIGEYAMVGAGAVVTADVPAHALVVGNPARRVAWISRSGEVLGADLICSRTGDKYVMTKMGLMLAE